MLKRGVLVLSVLCGVLALDAREAAAQQTVNFTFGYFTVRGEDARVDGDVLVDNRDFLVFDISDFNGLTIGGEWLIPLGQYFEAGAGVSFSRRTVASVYQDFIDSDGTEIDQDLRLRIVPVAFTVRVLPLGQSSAVQPYVGGGLGLFAWRYSETGEFVNFTQGNAIFNDQFVASGTEAGPIVLGGIRFASDSFTVGGEVRYQSADADLGTEFSIPGLNPRIDLGGWTYQATVGIRFGN